MNAAVPDRFVNFLSGNDIISSSSTRRPGVGKGIRADFLHYRGATMDFLLPLDQAQIKLFPNPLLISLTDDFVTRPIVGVTVPIDDRNCLGRGMF